MARRQTESPILSNHFFSRQIRYCVRCLLALWSTRERRISGLDIKLEALNAEPGSALRMEVDILGVTWNRFVHPRQGVVDRRFFQTTTRRLWRQLGQLAA